MSLCKITKGKLISILHRKTRFPNNFLERDLKLLVILDKSAKTNINNISLDPGPEITYKHRNLMLTS